MALLGAGLVLGCEALRGSATLLTSSRWPILEGAIAAVALAFAWRRQTELRLAPVLAIGLAFQVGWIAVHLALGVHSDGDSSHIYPQAGDALVAGTYPSSPYPAGAVLLFGLESLLSGGGSADRISNALLMVPFQLVTVVAIWSLRTRWCRWFAAVVAIWPLDAFFWEFKFDLAPTAALVVGLLLARRGRLSLSGLALGIGAALKWTPALSGVVLAVWLLRQGRRRDAAALLAALAGAFLLVNLPFLLSSPQHLLATYRFQGGRGISAESMYYVPPIVPFEKSVAIISHQVGAPGWANVIAVVLQIVLLLGVAAAAAKARDVSAVALAAMAPVVFLLSNRVFSPQYLVTMTAAWAVAGSLVARSSRDQLRLGALMLAATLANVLVYPTGALLWPTFTLLLFVAGFLATGWVTARSGQGPDAVSRGYAAAAVSAGGRIAVRARAFARSPGGAVVIAVFGLGIALRILFTVDYRPAFLGDPDAGSYINAAHTGLFANVYDPAGYPLFIRIVHALSPHLSLLIVIQHGLGVATAALMYLVVRRLTGSTLLGLLPAVVVLFDGFGLWVEHTPITETLFSFLVAASLYTAVIVSERGPWLLIAEGVLIACAGLVRPVGLILVPLVGAWVFLVRGGRARQRALALAALVVPACLIVGAYVLVQRSDTGFTGITQDSGRVIYARAATFARCSDFTAPAGTAALCQRIPPSKRGSFNQYLTGFPDHATAVSESGRSISPAWRVFGPIPGGNAKLAAWGEQAILHQPLDYISAVANDFHYFWADHHRAFVDADEQVNATVEQAVTGYYATGAGVHSDGLGFLRWYGESIEITGPLTILLLLAPLAALFTTRGRARRVAILLALTGWLLPLLAVAVASVDPRFILPAYGPLAASAAIGLSGTRLARQA